MKLNVQKCATPDCIAIVKFSKSGYCYKCSLAYRRKPDQKNLVKNIKCKTESCDELISNRKTTGLCSKCYTKQKPTKTLPKNITYICPNPLQNSDCLRGVLVDKYNFTDNVKHNRVCKTCATVNMVNTRMKNNSFTHTDETKQNISNGLKRLYENTDQTVWNKGLSKFTDERVAKTGKSRPKELNPMFGTSYKEKWANKYSDAEFIERMNYNAYLKSLSSLKYEEWIILHGQSRTAFKDYKREVWNCTNRQKIDQLPHYDKRGKSGVDGAYQLDHIVSIKCGFELNILPENIGSIENLWFVPWEVNLKKSQKNVSLSIFQEHYPIGQYAIYIDGLISHLIYGVWKTPLPKLIKIQ